MEDDSLRDEHTTGEDRVRMVARQLQEPWTVNRVAEEAGWSHGPTKRVLERLADDGVVVRDSSGSHTTYRADPRRGAIREATELRDTADSPEELTRRLEEMREQVEDWREELDVDGPNELRSTLGDPGLDEDELEHRREVARRWSHLERRMEIVEFALREWEFLSPDGDHASAPV